MTEKRIIDWEGIGREYHSGDLSIREIAARSGVTHTAIVKRAKRDGWPARPAVDRQKVVLAKPPAGAKPTDGFLYVLYIDAGGDRLFKIGRSVSFGSRFEMHQTSLPFELCVACCYFTCNAVAEERAIHQRFDGQRVRGEWFHLSVEDVAWIASRSLLL